LGIIVELLFELVFQVVGELLIEAGFRGVGRALSNRVVRIVLGVSVAVGGGFWFGRWWGHRQSAPGDTDLPSSFWVSLVLALAFGALALVRWLRERGRTPAEAPAEDALEHVSRLLNPFEWSAFRALTFALLNASIAWGITVGYTPHPTLG
jgi:hypothetical protein